MKNDLKAKVCTKCKKKKAIDQFSKMTRGHNGRRAQCKRCDHDYQAQRGLKIPQEGGEYKLTRQTMMNHMFIHFGWWESSRTSVERDQSQRDVRKYYKEEQRIEYKRDK